MGSAINKIVAEAIEKLSEISGTPRLDAEILLARVLKKPREYILVHPEKKLRESQIADYGILTAQRAVSKPLAYILGYKEFYGLDFKVTRDTLIPRPETELLAEEALKSIQNAKRKMPIVIIDVGTGSGNIIISIAKNIADSKFFGVDISSKALGIARQNAKKHNVAKKIKFIKSDLLKYFIDHCSLFTGHCIIIANLPYLSKKIYSQTMPDVKKYEPKSALYAGTDGLDYYKKLLKQIKRLQNSCFMLHASCFIEFSSEQKNKIEKNILKYFPEASLKFKKDLARKWRLVSFEI